LQKYAPTGVSKENLKPLSKDQRSYIMPKQSKERKTQRSPFMTHAEILEEIKKLSPRERLEVIDAAIHLLRDELSWRERTLTPQDRKRVLSQAANELLRDYETDSELTGFTALDAEDFHAQG
jgi:acyl-CoA reductase-like NAD-dependent aldehyde dehydrogenase